MKTIRFGLGTGLVLLVGLAMGACERRDRPMSDRSDQEPVRPAAPPSMQEGPARTTTDREANRQYDPSASDHTRMATSGNESAVASITQARCDRESRCDNVGSGKKYESMSDCVTKTRSDWRDDLNARECPQGVVPTQLSSCVKQIKEESCGNPVEKLESVLACRTVDLCKRG